MLQFPVPQFIDVEDKIIGPFTLKQFGFIFGGGLVIVALFRIIGAGIFFYLLAIPIAILDLGISFYRFNGRRMYDTFPIIIRFLTVDKKYLFRLMPYTGEMEAKPMDAAEIKIQTTKQEDEQRQIPSKLRQLSQLLDQKNQEELRTLNIKPNEQPKR